MFTDYYGLSFNPFDKQCMKERGAFRSQDHRQMQSRLDYLKTVRGIGVFTARPGMGKTYALRCFMNGLNPNQYQTAYINLSTISVTEFYRQFCDLLGLEPSGNKTQMFKAIQERVYYLYKEKKQPLILAIDEAQYLNYNILRDLKMLRNRYMKHCASGLPFIITMKGCLIRRCRTTSSINWNLQEEAGVSSEGMQSARSMDTAKGMPGRSIT